MFFTHDTDNQFYYYGEVQPYKGIYQEYLTSPKLIGVDVETISLKERIAIGVSIAVQPNLCFYFPLFPKESPVTPWHLLKDKSVTKVFHNAIFDLGCLTEFEVDESNIKDTNIMSRLLCYKDNSLIGLSYVHLMEVHEVKEFLLSHNATMMLECPQEATAKKCMQDSGASLKLFYELLPRTDMEYLNIEMQVIPILLKMSRRGVLIDQQVRFMQEEILEDEVDGYTKMCEEIGFNPGSNQQVAYTLAKRGAYNVFSKLPFTKSRKGLSASEETLAKMDDPLANLVLVYREKSYLLSHYIMPWAKEERAYCRFHMDAITGRPSSTDRNMQNIPKGETRGMFLPDSGTWTDTDFSQIELRTLAYLSQDREMQYIFNLPQHLPDGSRNTEADIHFQTAEFMGIKRDFAKNVNFAMIYGATDQTIAETAHIRSVERAGQLKKMWFAKYPQAGDYISYVQADALKTGRARTVFGRDIRLPTEDEESIDGIGRKAVNYPIQGTAAEILKRALIRCKDMDMALQVHDELLVDGFILYDEFKPLENIAPFRTPVEVKYLERWE